MYAINVALYIVVSNIIIRLILLLLGITKDMHVDCRWRPEAALRAHKDAQDNTDGWGVR